MLRTGALSWSGFEARRGENDDFCTFGGEDLEGCIDGVAVVLVEFAIARCDRSVAPITCVEVPCSREEDDDVGVLCLDELRPVVVVVGALCSGF